MTGTQGVLRVATALMYIVAAVLCVTALRDKLGGRRQAVQPSTVVATPADPMDSEAFAELASTGRRIGPEDAVVTIVEFSNYLCGYCIRFEEVTSRPLARYPDHVAIVMRHFLPEGDRYQKAIEMAAECAADQGKFDKFNHLFFVTGRDHVTREPWKDVGAAAGVADMRKFTNCVRSGKYADRVKHDSDLGVALGVKGTPTSFVNGRRAIGAATFEALDGFIVAELRQKRPTTR